MRIGAVHCVESGKEVAAIRYEQSEVAWSQARTLLRSTSHFTELPMIAKVNLASRVKKRM